MTKLVASFLTMAIIGAPTWLFFTILIGGAKENSNEWMLFNNIAAILFITAVCGVLGAAITSVWSLTQ